MGIVFDMASSRKWILFWTTGHTKLQWRAMVEQLLIFNTVGWSLDAAAPTVPYSSLLQDSQILPVEPGTARASLHLPPLLLFCMSRRSWTGIFGAALSPVFIASPGKESPLLQNANVGCLGLQGPHLCSGFSKPVVVAQIFVSGLLAWYFTAVPVQLKCNLFFLYH